MCRHVAKNIFTLSQVHSRLHAYIWWFLLKIVPHYLNCSNHALCSSSHKQGSHVPRKLVARDWQFQKSTIRRTNQRSDAGRDISEQVTLLDLSSDLLWNSSNIRVKTVWPLDNYLRIRQKHSWIVKWPTPDRDATPCGWHRFCDFRFNKFQFSRWHDYSRLDFMNHVCWIQLKPQWLI